MRKLLNSQQGFTLIEALVALTLFSIVAAVMAPSFVSHLKFNHKSEVRLGAIAASQEVLDELRNINPETMPTTGADPARNVVAGERTYQVTVHYCLRNTFCTGRSRHLKLDIKFNTEMIYEVETVFTRLR